MTEEKRQYVFLGLSITSSWGNGHATTYRGLIKELAKRGHQVTFLERDVPWYASHREFAQLAYCNVLLYANLDELKDRFSDVIRQADAIVIGSYVPDGIAIGRWARSLSRNIVAFYDIDTPVTLGALAAGTCEYLAADLVARYDLYLSFTGGPTLDFIEKRLYSACARPLYCSVDPSLYFPERLTAEWEMAYLGTYAADRQPSVDRLFTEVARKQPDKQFAVAGPQYPDDICWPSNVTHIPHLSAADHRQFYNSQRLTLNVTRLDMIRAGFSPSVRLFEAAACGVPILTDKWAGLDHFFEPGSEIIPVEDTHEVLEAMKLPQAEIEQIAERARCRTLRFHTAAVRAQEFDGHMTDAIALKRGSRRFRVVASRSATHALSIK